MAAPPGEEVLGEAASSGGSGSRGGVRTGQGAGACRWAGGRSVWGLNGAEVGRPVGQQHQLGPRLSGGPARAGRSRCSERAWKLVFRPAWGLGEALRSGLCQRGSHLGSGLSQRPGGGPSQAAGTAAQNPTGPVAYEQQPRVSHGSGGWEFKIKGPLAPCSRGRGAERALWGVF